MTALIKTSECLRAHRHGNCYTARCLPRRRSHLIATAVLYATPDVARLFHLRMTALTVPLLTKHRKCEQQTFCFLPSTFQSWHQPSGDRRSMRHLRESSSWPLQDKRMRNLGSHSEITIQPSTVVSANLQEMPILELLPTLKGPVSRVSCQFSSHQRRRKFHTNFSTD